MSKNFYKTTKCGASLDVSNRTATSREKESMKKAAVGTKAKNVTSIYVQNNGGEEAAKEMINLMQSLFKPGRKDSYEVTFNLPPRSTKKRHRAQLKRILASYSTTTLLYFKVPEYKIFRSIQYKAENELPCILLPSSDCISNRIDRRVGAYDMRSKRLSSRLYMGQQVDELKICLKKLTDIIEHSDHSKQHEEVNIANKLTRKKGLTRKREDKKMIKKPEENNDELTFVLQNLYKNFDRYIPVLEQNSGYANDLLNFIVEIKKRISKVEQDLFRYIRQDGVQISMPKQDKSTADIRSNEKQLNQSKLFVNETNNSFVKASTSNQIITESSPGWVLLPKGYHMVKSFTEISDGFDLYLLHKVNDEVEPTDSSYTSCLKSQLNLDRNNVDECLLKTVMNVKPSIDSDEIQSNFDSLSSFPVKQTYNLDVPPSLKRARTSGILGNISIITKLIGNKLKPVIESKIKADAKIIEENSDTINNEENKTSTSVKEKKIAKNHKTSNSNEKCNISEKNKSSKKKNEQTKNQCLIL
ncbi:hypothetical protein O3M35_010737 [Rhynocoris fuscipes]|uniref:Uncharacterized protein n=1 Tax=Rhynocoris fuscipes TaxID=488301 RepID=A0AAW1D1F1_9HEMI